MTEQVIKCITYIATSRESLWDALTNPEVTELYWAGTRLESDWNVGSTILFRHGETITDKQTLLDFDAPRFMRYTFNPVFEPFAGEAPSQVTFELIPGGEVVKLIVTHDHFPPGSKVYPACSEGWPSILSALKTLMESGKPLPDFVESS
jgi:uncharacterized protein YndB with AHSA1/START domain